MKEKERIERLEQAMAEVHDRIDFLIRALLEQLPDEFRINLLKINWKKNE